MVPYAKLIVLKLLRLSAIIRKSSPMVLVFGIALGMTVAFVYSRMLINEHLRKHSSHQRRVAKLSEYHPLWDTDEYLAKKYDEKHNNSDSPVRIVCLILTQPSNHKIKAKTVKNTWARRCSETVFISSKPDELLGSVIVVKAEGRDHLWTKTKSAFKYLYAHYRDKADWFLKADDDTYVITENLERLLVNYNSSFPIWFGRRSRLYVLQGYMSGGAAYVLSKKALEKFVEEALTSPEKCRPDGGGDEDIEMGRCLQNVGVWPGDSRDHMDRERFFPLPPMDHLIPGVIGKGHWLWMWNYYPMTVGLDCCSDTAISFHYIGPVKMYELEYLLYHLRPVRTNSFGYLEEVGIKYDPNLPPQAYNKKNVNKRPNEDHSRTDIDPNLLLTNNNLRDGEQKLSND